jgi:hypothetical protein
MPPISGKIDGTLESDFTNTSLNVAIKKGETNPAVFKKEYGLTQPLMHFWADFSTKITPNSTKTRGAVTSDLTSFIIEGSPTHDVMMKELLRQMKSNGKKRD